MERTTDNEQLDFGDTVDQMDKHRKAQKLIMTEPPKNQKRNRSRVDVRDNAQFA